jgi:N-acetylglutamate synthase-like GNAT family acetyltransferase
MPDAISSVDGGDCFAALNFVQALARSDTIVTYFLTTTRLSNAKPLRCYASRFTFYILRYFVMTGNQDFTIRKPRPADVPRMMPLLDKYVRENEILPRTVDDVYRSIREWAVAEAQNTQIVGVGSLAIMSSDLAEVRSLVVHPDYHGRGIGRGLVGLLLAEAKLLAVGRVFALTRKPQFFLRLGFQLTRIEKLPRKVRRDCVFCPIFHACDEVALVLDMKKESSLDILVDLRQNGAVAAPETVLVNLPQQKGDKLR